VSFTILTDFVSNYENVNMSLLLFTTARHHKSGSETLKQMTRV